MNELYFLLQKSSIDEIDYNSLSEMNLLYDFKFGNANMSSSQYMKYTTIFDGYEIVIVRP